MITQLLMPTLGIVPLKLTDSAAVARELMTDGAQRELPVLQDGKPMGMLPFSAVRDSKVKRLSALEREFVQAQATADTTLFDLAGMMFRNRISLVPVVDNEGFYVHCVSIFDVVSQVAELGSVSNAGGVLVLEVGLHDYSLSEIARLVESNNASVIACAVTSPSAALNIQVTLKVNTSDLNAIVATFERYDYTVLSYYQQEDVEDYYAERYRALMAYLNV